MILYNYSNKLLSWFSSQQKGAWSFYFSAMALFCISIQFLPIKCHLKQAADDISPHPLIIEKSFQK